MAPRGTCIPGGFRRRIDVSRLVHGLGPDGLVPNGALGEGPCETIATGDRSNWKCRRYSCADVTQHGQHSQWDGKQGGCSRSSQSMVVS